MNEISPRLLEIWQQLIKYKKNHKIPSGLLLMGEKNSDKLSIAIDYAQYILCRSSDEKSCGSCRSCVLFAAKTHPDYFFVTPEEKSSTIKIEQIRELIDTLNQTSALGGFQIVLIALAEEMNQAAANALLKTLEEPRGNVLLLLISTQPTLIPATIRSRCQQIKLPGVLHDASICPPEEQALCDSLVSDLERIHTGTLDPVIAASNAVNQPNEKLELLLTLTLDMIRMKLCAASYLNHPDKKTALASLSHTRSIEKLFYFMEVILEGIRLLIQRNHVNLQLLMEKIFMGWRYNNDIS